MGPGDAETLWGKYRGTVLDTNDPLMLGRVRAAVPALPEMILSWAMPCLPYPASAAALSALPPVGANVWIEFERGNAEYPIWTGCFWEAGQAPLARAVAGREPQERAG